MLCSACQVIPSCSDGVIVTVFGRAVLRPRQCWARHIVHDKWRLYTFLRRYQSVSDVELSVRALILFRTLCTSAQLLISVFLCSVAIQPTHESLGACRGPRLEDLQITERMSCGGNGIILSKAWILLCRSFSWNILLHLSVLVFSSMLRLCRS